MPQLTKQDAIDGILVSLLAVGIPMLIMVAIYTIN
jgi:hypothetical protein